MVDIESAFMRCLQDTTQQRHDLDISMGVLLRHYPTCLLSCRTCSAIETLVTYHYKQDHRTCSLIPCQKVLKCGMAKQNKKKQQFDAANIFHRWNVSPETLVSKEEKLDMFRKYLRELFICPVPDDRVNSLRSNASSLTATTSQLKSRGTPATSLETSGLTNMCIRHFQKYDCFTINSEFAKYVLHTMSVPYCW